VGSWLTWRDRCGSIAAHSAVRTIVVASVDRANRIGSKGAVGSRASRL